MAEIGLPVPEVIEVGTPPAEDDGKGVGDNGLIPILSVTFERIIKYIVAYFVGKIFAYYLGSL